MLKLAAGATLLAACTPKAASSAATAPVVIVGAGTAGLTAAYRLQQAGVPAQLYEASNRAGGRMFTKRDGFPDGLFCELGGELVDSDHVQLIALATELGVPIQPLLEGDPGEDLFFFGGKIRTVKDMLDPVKGSGAFVRIAKAIATDQGQLIGPDDAWTDRARALDATPLSDYLNGLRSGSKDDWVIDMLDGAYAGELGLPTSQQSALNLVDYISVDTTKPFSVFGDSDEAFRIQGGSSSLPEALFAKLDDAYKPKFGWTLTGLERSGAGVRIAFDGPDGPTAVEAPQVILALPFTRLREVQGLGALGLGAAKMKAIQELSYGQNSKVMTATSSRVWRTREAGLPAPSNGSVYTDLPFQQVWETSRGQDGASGLLTNFLAPPASLKPEAELRATLRDGLTRYSPAIAESLTSTGAAMFWPRHPQIRGSYACAGVGQYTSILEETSSPELDGAILFAGEHTSPEFLGFMNGAVESGERVARELLASRAPAETKKSA
jgi:monoamine oxidase